MPFELPEVFPVQFTNSNPRSEFHGEEHVRAIDIAMTIEGSNDLLDLIEPGLTVLHYTNREGEAGQQPLESGSRYLPNLRHPKLPRSYAYAKGEHWRGYRWVLEFGRGTRAIDLADCVLTGMRYELQEGGSVTIGFTVQYNGAELNDDRLYGRLAALPSLGEGLVQLLAPAALMPVKKGWRSGKADTSLTDGGGELFEQEPDADTEQDVVHPEGSPEAALAGAAAADAKPNGEAAWPFPNSAHDAKPKGGRGRRAAAAGAGA